MGDESNRQVYLNGRILPADAAGISISDAGFLHGASTFTTMYAHNGKVFRLGTHLDRLLATVDLLGLRTDMDRNNLAGGLAELIEVNGLSFARCRITLTPGPVGSDEPTSLITADPLPDYPQRWYTEGLGLVVSSFVQRPGDPTYGFKTGCYFPRLLAQREALQKGMDEALWFTPDHRLAEACMCNVFLVNEGTVRTPPRDTPVLPGVVREAVLELCSSLEIPVDGESPLTIKDVLGADEIFLTGSTTGLRPAVRVEKHEVGDGRPGPVTKTLRKAYQEMLDNECPPPDGANR